MKRASLSSRLYRRVLLLLAMTGLGIGISLYVVAAREIRRSTDAQLVNASRLLYMMTQNGQSARLLGGAVAGQADAGQADSGRLLSPEEKSAFAASYGRCMFAVFWEGRLVAHSGWGAPVGLVPRQPGLHHFSAHNDRWRSYAHLGNDDRLLIVVAERDTFGEVSIVSALRQLVVPITILLIVGLAMLWWTLRTSLSEIGRLATIIHDRSLVDLSPLDPMRWSRDLAPLIVALNKLFVRLGDAYEQEQSVTDDVAHELRTPLAAIRTQAQLMLRAAPADRDDDVAGLIRGVDRANRLIDGMLTLARLHATATVARSVDVHALIGDVVAEAILRLPDDAIEFTVSPDHGVRWRCDAGALTIALSAIVDNAVRHAGSGGRIDIAVVHDDRRLTITVGDRGPGVPPDDRERLLRRFERGGTSSPGNGLGLSIAVKAVRLTGGALHLENRRDGPGLHVVVTLPAGI